MEVGYDERKFAELLLYIAEPLQNDRAGGATKLNKVVFFAEFTHLRRHHRVISGCDFQKLSHGPAPRQLVPVRDRLVRSGAADLVEEDFLAGHNTVSYPNALQTSPSSATRSAEPSTTCSHSSMG